jgi:GTP pyrophosphokinase
MKTKMIKQAVIFAKKAHKGQKQATGEPYVNHPIKVAKLLKKWKQKDEIITAGLLHDVVEDCNVPLKEIEKMFGKKVSNLVDAMSFVLTKKGKTIKKNMPATYKKFAKYALKDPFLILIKTADMLSNIPNINVPSHRNFVINKSYPRLMMFWIPLIKEVGFKKEAKRITKEFNKYTKRKVKSVLYVYISKKELKYMRKALKEFKQK